MISGMTPLDLQETLIAELTALFDGELFPEPRRKTTEPDNQVPLNFYKQALPWEVKNGAKDGSFLPYMPYIFAQLQDGKQDRETEPAEVVMILNIGLFSDDSQNQGHIFLFNIIERIRQHLFTTRTIGDKYHIRLPFEWKTSDDDNWPYFIGAVETHWDMPLIIPEDANL